MGQRLKKKKKKKKTILQEIVKKLGNIKIIKFFKVDLFYQAKLCLKGTIFTLIIIKQFFSLLPDHTKQ